MGFRSYFFVRRLLVRNYGSALMSRHRIEITRIVFVKPSAASSSSSTLWSNRFVASSDLD